MAKAQIIEGEFHLMDERQVDPPRPIYFGHIVDKNNRYVFVLGAGGTNPDNVMKYVKKKYPDATHIEILPFVKIYLYEE